MDVHGADDFAGRIDADHRLTGPLEETRLLADEPEDARGVDRLPPVGAHELVVDDRLHGAGVVRPRRAETQALGLQPVRRQPRRLLAPADQGRPGAPRPPPYGRLLHAPSLAQAALRNRRWRRRVSG